MPCLKLTGVHGSPAAGVHCDRTSAFLGDPQRRVYAYPVEVLEVGVFMEEQALRRTGQPALFEVWCLRRELVHAVVRVGSLRKASYCPVGHDVDVQGGLPQG